MQGRTDAPTMPTLEWFHKMTPVIYEAFPNNRNREMRIGLDRNDKSIFNISFYDQATGYYFSFKVVDDKIVEIKNNGVCMY